MRTPCLRIQSKDRAEKSRVPKICYESANFFHILAASERMPQIKFNMVSYWQLIYCYENMKYLDIFFTIYNGKRKLFAVKYGGIYEIENFW